MCNDDDLWPLVWFLRWYPFNMVSGWVERTHNWTSLMMMVRTRIQLRSGRLGVDRVDTSSIGITTKTWGFRSTYEEQYIVGIGVVLQLIGLRCFETCDMMSVMMLKPGRPLREYTRGFLPGGSGHLSSTSFPPPNSNSSKLILPGQRFHSWPPCSLTKTLSQSGASAGARSIHPQQAREEWRRQRRPRPRGPATAPPS